MHTVTGGFEQEKTSDALSSVRLATRGGLFRRWKDACRPASDRIFRDVIPARRPCERRQLQWPKRTQCAYPLSPHPRKLSQIWVLLVCLKALFVFIDVYLFFEVFRDHLETHGFR